MLLVLIVMIATHFYNAMGGFVAGLASVPVLSGFAQATYDFLNATLP